MTRTAARTLNRLSHGGCHTDVFAIGITSEPTVDAREAKRSKFKLCVLNIFPVSNFKFVSGDLALTEHTAFNVLEHLEASWSLSRARSATVT